MISRISIIIVLFINICFVESRRAFPDTTDNVFLQECVNQHNRFRRRHRAPDLRLSDRIVNYSRRRAQLMSEYEGLSHGHQGLRDYGENLFWRIGVRAFRCDDAVRSWYNEYRRYDYLNPGFSPRTGHFTQLVWVNTRWLGCARASERKANNQIESYIVCNYEKPGNIRGMFRKNVLRPTNSNNNY